jgi:hypothetical protein
MSGGSLEYLHCEMREGRVDRFIRYADDLESGLVQLLTEVGFLVPAVNDALARVRRARYLLAELQKELVSLAPAAHAIEWWRSGDWTEDQAGEEIAEELPR